MQFTKDQIIAIMQNEKCPLSLKYDCDWILQNSMGSHSLWLLESLILDMDLDKNKRILDLGCGKAAGSIFLAKEIGANIWAVDRMKTATDNYKRACDMGVSDLVCPVSADAIDLTFAEDFFDTMISINSLFFYVTDSEILKDKILKFIKHGCQIGIIVPGFCKEVTPEDLGNNWHDDFYKWHTLDWWKECFNNTNDVELLVADTLPDNEGNIIYNKYAMIVNAHEEPNNIAIKDLVTFIRIIACKK